MATNARPPPNLPSTCFSCERLNPTTFRINENDGSEKGPFIYVKVYPNVYPNVLVLIDTGCGGTASDAPAEVTSLRSFIETYPVKDNDWTPLNPLNPRGRKRYVVVCTHCHYDRIGAIPQFTDTIKFQIWASANAPAFIQTNLPSNSLCSSRGIPTPDYTVTDWAEEGEEIIMREAGGRPFESGLDPAERVLFVGDTLYEDWPIFFYYNSSDLRDYAATLLKLEQLLSEWNDEGAAVGGKRVMLACGRATSGADAHYSVAAAGLFFSEVLRGLVNGMVNGIVPFNQVRRVLLNGMDPGEREYEGQVITFSEEDTECSFVMTIAMRGR